MTFGDLLSTTHISHWLTGLVAFVSVFVSEVVWVLCVRWTSHNKTARAAIAASFMVLVGWAGLVVLLGNPLVAIPCEMIGAAAGTVLAMRIDR